MSDPLSDELRKALAASPDNLPLRLCLAKLLAQHHRYDEAEQEFQQALRQAPDDLTAKSGLAECFYRRGKASAAVVLCEQLIESGNAPASTFLTYAHCLHSEGQEQRAVAMYAIAKNKDPTLCDEDLEQLSVRQNRAVPQTVTGNDPLPKREFVHGDPEGTFAPHAEKPRIRFADVGGMDALKEQIRLKIIHPLNSPEIYAAYGMKAGGGILLYGPPGCGKTHLARATAGEVNAKFIAVGISDVLDMYIGQSEKNLADIFRSARANSPCILFFDEVDALAASRRDMRQSAGRQIINQFLAELDGVDHDNTGVLIMAATNAPWHLDGAFRRPGRFDRIVFVPPPDAPAREAVLTVLLTGKPAADVDVQQVSKKTEGMSGADLNAVIHAAIEVKLQAALKSGVPSPLTTKDLLSAVKQVKASTREWFASARNHALYANANGHYDDVIDYMKQNRL